MRRFYNQLIMCINKCGTHQKIDMLIDVFKPIDYVCVEKYDCELFVLICLENTRLFIDSVYEVLGLLRRRVQEQGVPCFVLGTVRRVRRDQGEDYQYVFIAL